MLAIVIPYYKKLFFKQTLDSLVNQTNKNFRVYIGNDNSPEDPSSIIEEYKSKLNLIYKSFNNNLGKKSLVKHWDRCLGLTNNEKWINILGDDDVYESNVVEMFYLKIEEVEKNEATVIRFASTKINELSQNISDIYYHPILENSSEFLFRKTRSSLSEYFFKKEKLFHIGIRNYPLAWCSDKMLVFEVSRSSKIYTINEAHLKIRISYQSISGSDKFSVPKKKAEYKYYFDLLNFYHLDFSSDQKSKIKTKLKNLYFNNKYFGSFYLMNCLIFTKRMEFKEMMIFQREILLRLKEKFVNWNTWFV